MNKPIPTRHACAVLLAFGGFCLLPQAQAGDAMAKKMDTDGDGKVSAAEHAAATKAMFARMDADKDGSVTAAEMDASHAAMKKDGQATDSPMSSVDKIKTIDTDGDGRISAAEHEAGSKLMFAKMDSDMDGAVTAAEMEAGHKAAMSGKK